MRAAGGRERRGRAARGGRQRRQRRACWCRRATRARWPPRSRRCSPSPGAPSAWARAARARVERVFQWKQRRRGARATSSRRRCVLLTVDLERLRLRPGERLLDAGCGEGRHCFGALERGAHVVGLDLDPAAPARGTGAPARCAPRELGAARRHAAGQRLPRCPSPTRCFDKVICSEVMEHVHDYRARGARARARDAARRAGGGDDPDRDQRAPLPARRRRLLRVARRPHPHLPAARAGAGPRARRASRRPASASPTRCTRPTGCCARSPGCRAPTRAGWCARTAPS